MMCITFSFNRTILAVAFTLAAFSVQAATPLSYLYSAVPSPPADADQALVWMDGGEIVHAKFVAITAALAVERAKIAELNGGDPPSARITVPARLADTAEIQAAAGSYGEYLAKTEGADGPQAVLGKRKRWLQAAFGRNQMEISKEMTVCDAPCTDATVLEANRRLMSRRDYELKTEIRAWNAMFDDWKTKRFGVVIAGDARIAATAGGTAAISAQGRSLMASYQAAMLDEIELLLSISKLCVLRAAAIMKGLDGSESDGISGASKKAAK